MAPNQKYDFTGKVALVTGSSSGIGAAIAVQLAQYGAHVAITGRSVAGLAKTTKEILAVSNGVAPLQIIGDLLDDSVPEKLITQTLSKYGRLDFLVNNAGGGTPNGTFASATLLAEYDAVFKLNLRSVIELTQRAVPHLEATKGSIINISSVASTKPFVGALIYGASKAALDMVTKTSALELGPKGIRVNSVNPGPVVTAFARSMGVDAESSKLVASAMAPALLLKRVGQPEDIANLTSFLLSDDAQNITGSIMVSDSGTLLSFPEMKMEDFQEQVKKVAK